MAENVVFDNQQADAGQEAAETAVGQDQAVGGGEGEGGDPPVDGGEESEVEEAPQPTGIAGLFANGRWKKIAIAAGILLILIIIIILIIPKNQRGTDVELVWWGLWEDSATVQPLIDGFEKQNPHIKISYVKQDPEKYRDTLLTRINNGSGPDIFRYHNSWLPIFVKVLSPLPKDVISAADFNSEYYKVIQNDVVRAGAIYGVPIGVDSIALFVNTDMLNAAGLSYPKNWNEFKDFAQRMTVKDPDTKKIEVAGAALGTYQNVLHAPDIISIMFIQQGVDLNKINQYGESLGDALSFYTSFSKGQDAVWDNSLDNSVLAFARGKAAMYFGYSWDVFTIEKLKSNNGLKYAIYPVPGITGGKNLTVASYWVEGVSSRSKNQKEAMLFMHYLTQKDTLEKFYTEASKSRLFGEPYPRKDMADELKDNPMVYPFVSQLEDASSSYFASDTKDGDTGLNSRANTYLQNLLNAITNDNSSIKKSLEPFFEGIGKVLKDYGIK